MPAGSAHSRQVMSLLLTLKLSASIGLRGMQALGCYACICHISVIASALIEECCMTACIPHEAKGREIGCHIMWRTCCSSTQLLFWLLQPQTSSQAVSAGMVLQCKLQGVYAHLKSFLCVIVRHQKHSCVVDEHVQRQAQLNVLVCKGLDGPAHAHGQQ